jgi:predicted CXXCH cytochrome family protein
VRLLTFLALLPLLAIVDVPRADVPRADAPTTDERYVGSEVCQSCHQAEYSDWTESHHYRAMQAATPENVLGDFNNAVFEYGGLSHRFFRDGEKFRVETDNAKGELEVFEISYTFGFEPLQQYLIGFPDGRYQALNIVWDNRPKTEGGQRWYHLYPEEDEGGAITSQDALHWTGSFQNWNSRCANCHSTRLEKNYDAGKNTYNTTWAEMTVGCESCHGPGKEHVDWARDSAGSDKSQTDPGFVNDLSKLSPWVPDGDKSTFRYKGEGTSHGQQTNQAGTCAACHSRRAEMDEDHAGKAYTDLFQLRLINQPLYYPDGQVLDEVYVYGSFLQSKMYQAGVTCSNCHQPHSGKLVAEGNAVCAQCHKPAVFDQPSHHHHENGSEGAACASCHMPATTYMGVDSRRDHGFRVPQPQLTTELQIPNACNRCHSDKDAAWATAAVDEWYPNATARYPHSQVFAAARANHPEAAVGLAAIANNPTMPDILRATAVEESGRFPSEAAIPFLQTQLEAESPLIRAAAVFALEFLPGANRYSMLQPLITDPSKLVRMNVASRLADISPQQLSPNGQGELRALQQEYLDWLKLNGDSPESLLSLGVFLGSQNQMEGAERAYRQALRISPGFIPALLNLADLYRQNEMDDQAAILLKQALSMAPDSASAQHAMGLLLVRQKRLQDALPYLQQAADLAPADPRYSYVYGVALWESAQQALAIQVLEAAWQRQPGNPELRAALQAYYQQLGATDKL